MQSITEERGLRNAARSRLTDLEGQRPDHRQRQWNWPGLEIINEESPFPERVMEYAAPRASEVAYDNQVVALGYFDTFPRCAKARRAPGGRYRLPGLV